MVNSRHIKVINISTLLVLTLLLSTNNFSVAIVSTLLIYALIYLSKKYSNITIDKTDWIVIGCLSAYFISNIPLTIIDWGNFRYFKGASRLLLCIPIYLMMKTVINNSAQHIKFIIYGTLGGSLGALAIAIYQSIVEGRVRVDGFLYSINFGYLACMLVILAIGLLHYKEYKFLLAVSILAASIAMLLTLTRGAILTPPAIILLAIFLNRKRLTLIKSCVITIITVLAISSVYQSSSHFKQRVDFTLQEFSQISQGHIEKSVSSGVRMLLWRASIEAFKINPIIGLTHPEREALNQQLATDGVVTDWVAKISRGHAHSQYFEMLASGGLLGVLAIIFMLIIPFIYFIKHQASSNAAYVGALFVSSSALICLTEVALQQNLISTFYGFMISLLFALTKADLRVKENT